MSADAGWCEIWADEGLDPPYLLIVRSRGDGQVEILDPRDDHRVVHVAGSYEAARLWLNEDEYTQVVGRMLSAEGQPVTGGRPMGSTDEQPWAVVGWDAFEGREYPVSRHSTESEAKEAGRKQLIELARDQPSETSGGQDGIQDRVCITGPEGIRYRLL